LLLGIYGDLFNVGGGGVHGGCMKSIPHSVDIPLELIEVESATVIRSSVAVDAVALSALWR